MSAPRPSRTCQESLVKVWPIPREIKDDEEEERKRQSRRELKVRQLILDLDVLVEVIPHPVDEYTVHEIEWPGSESDTKHPVDKEEHGRP